MQVVGVDVGGTNIEVGLVGDGHEVLERGKENTSSEGPDAVVDAIAERVEAASRTRVLRASPDLRSVAAGLGDDARVVGAAALDRSSVIAG